MNWRDSWIRRGIAAVLLATLVGMMMPAGIGSARANPSRATGCRAWSPVFRPVLGVLGAGRILVALPTHVPHFGHRVYAHANVLKPPLTFDVVLSTRPGHSWPVPSRTTLLAVRGVAGPPAVPSGSTTVVVHGKRLDVLPVSRRMRSVLWHDRDANITYTVMLPSQLGKAALLRVASSLTPGALRKTPITAGPARFNACP